jgi:hypothetical protein
LKQGFKAKISPYNKHSLKPLEKVSSKKKGFIMINEALGGYTIQGEMEFGSTARSKLSIQDLILIFHNIEFLGRDD